jgi:hypothetical protein
MSKVLKRSLFYKDNMIGSLNPTLKQIFLSQRYNQLQHTRVTTMYYRVLPLTEHFTLGVGGGACFLGPFY